MKTKKYLLTLKCEVEVDANEKNILPILATDGSICGFVTAKGKEIKPCVTLEVVKGSKAKDVPETKRVKLGEYVERVLIEMED